MSRTRWLRSLWLVVGVFACGIALAACGGDDEGDTTETTAAAETETQAADSGLAELQEKVDSMEKIPEFEPPGPAFDASKAAGKLIFSIPVASSIPFNKAIQEAEQKAAELVGAKVKIWPSTGQPSEWVQGFQAAISQKADLISLLGPNPDLLKPQLAQAKRAGIPVTMNGFYGESSEFAPEFSGGVRFPFGLAGELEAAYPIVETEQKVNAIVIVSNDIPQTPLIVDGIKAEFAKSCPDCDVTYVNVPVADWATKTASEVQSALLKNPNANYVIPIYDGLAIYAVSAVRSAGAADRVKISTFNGTPAILDLIQKGEVVAMDFGTSSTQIGYTDMDAAFRVLAGVDPVTPTVPGRIFDSSNIDEAGVPAQLDMGYGDAYKAGFEELWGLTE